MPTTWKRQRPSNSTEAAMSENTKIEWATHTFNPWEGCQKVGPGCDHCYAETRNARFGGGKAINWGPGAPRRRTSEANWNLPRRWHAQHEAFVAQHGHRQRVFCASLADVFDNAVAREWRDDLATLILNTPNLDWLLLTKRIGNAGDMLGEMFLDGPPDNLWLGATIVNQAEGDRDIPKLLAAPAAKRFLSMEPLLGPVDLSVIDLGGHREIYPLRGTGDCEDDDGDPRPDLPGIDWVIVGGESGPGARPMDPAWAISLRDQCQAADVPFLFKQWGEWTYASAAHGTASGRYALVPRMYDGPILELDRAPLPSETFGMTVLKYVGKKAAGRLLDGCTWDGVPG
jgi:protein gp37